MLPILNFFKYDINEDTIHKKTHKNKNIFKIHSNTNSTVCA